MGRVPLSRKSGNDTLAWNEGRPEYPGQHRVAPRECVRVAQEEMAKAWGTADPREAVLWIRSSVDWLRRALEQMAADQGPIQPPFPSRNPLTRAWTRWRWRKNWPGSER